MVSTGKKRASLLEEARGYVNEYGKWRGTEALLAGSYRHRVGSLLVLARADAWWYRNAARRPPGVRPDVERVYFHHIRKTGGTSLARSLLEIGGEEAVAVERRLARSPMHFTVTGGVAVATGWAGIIERGRYWFAFSHIPAHELRIPEATFTVTILRDPLERLMSYYRYLVAGDGKDVGFRVSHRERATAAGGFRAFIDAAPKEEVLRQAYTFSKGLCPEEAALQAMKCSCVLYNESFNDGVCRLGRSLGVAIRSRRDRVTRQDADEIRGEDLEYAVAVLKPEYEMLKLLAGFPGTGAVQRAEA